MGKHNLLSSSVFLLHVLSILLSVFPNGVAPLPPHEHKHIPNHKQGISLPLSTNSRWIADRTGRLRVKLACVNWAAHLEPVVAEGLSKQPLDAISKRIKDMGFNCVRLTWPLFLATDKALASLTVLQSFTNLGLQEAIAGLRTNNPSLLGLSLMDAFQAVVSNLGNNSLMVILDNHISKPGWCCSQFDENGFFGDRYLDPREWIAGLTSMALHFRGTPNVVGMSLRNELRGPRENQNDWFRYMRRGAAAVHAANPHILVIISGLNFDKDLSFLRNQLPLNLRFTGKIVFEIHWYSFYDERVWESNGNEACRIVKRNLSNRAWFLLKKGFPVFVSEFGGNLAGTDSNDNRFLDCFFRVASGLDLDWAYWTVVGSYYTRTGLTDMDELFGLLTRDWRNIRNPIFFERLAAIQRPRITRI